MITCGGRALDRDGGREPYQLEPNSEYRRVQRGRQTPGAKVRGQKGNSPDHQLRSPRLAKWKTKWEGIDSQEVGLEAAILQRKRNSSLIESSCAEDVTGLSNIPKLRMHVSAW